MASNLIRRQCFVFIVGTFHGGQKAQGVQTLGGNQDLILEIINISQQCLPSRSKHVRRSFREGF